MALMKKDECERAIRNLCHEWRKEAGLSKTPAGELHFSQFFSWMQQRYPSYLNFRTITSVRYDAEMWFDQEFKQTWRN